MSTVCCATCGVAANGKEEDGTAVRWVKLRKDPSTGDAIPEGRECYPCSQIRLRCVANSAAAAIGDGAPHDKKKKKNTDIVSQHELIQKFKENEQLRIDFLDLRKRKVAKLLSGGREKFTGLSAAAAAVPKLDLATYQSVRSNSSYADMFRNFKFTELDVFVGRELGGTGIKYQSWTQEQKLTWCKDR